MPIDSIRYNLTGYRRYCARDNFPVVPVFELEGIFYIQKVDAAGLIENMVRLTKTNRGRIVLLDESDLQVVVGGKRMYGFFLKQNNAVFGTREVISAILDSSVRCSAVKQQPFHAMSVAKFIGDDDLETVSSVHCFTLLQDISRNVAKNWLETADLSSTIRGDLEDAMQVSAETSDTKQQNHTSSTLPNITIIGIGGGGCNSVEHLESSGLKGFNFHYLNTDNQALEKIKSKNTLLIGSTDVIRTGTKVSPEEGRLAALHSRVDIESKITGSDIIFLLAGMGGGTGTGASAVVAKIASDCGILCVAVATQPFPFEGHLRANTANNGLRELEKNVSTLFVIPNSKLLTVLGKNITVLDAFRASNDVSRVLIQGVSELLTNPGLINIDFGDIYRVLSIKGLGYMGSGVGRGDDRATEAAEMAISSPLLEDVDIANAGGVIVNITTGLDMSIGEFEEVGNVVRSFTADDAIFVIGTAIDENLDGEFRVSIIITGWGKLEDDVRNRQPVVANSRTLLNKDFETAENVGGRFTQIIRKRARSKK